MTDLLSSTLDVDVGSSVGNDTDQDVEMMRYLAIGIRARTFAVELQYVREIVGLQPMTPVHDAPSYVRGLMNLRGHVVPLVDAAERIGEEPCAYNDRTAIVVLALPGGEVGIIVDRVERVLDLPVPDAEGDKGRANYLRGVHHIAEGTIVCLDPDWLAGTRCAPERDAGAEP
ncbi:MAG: chemotaxis protein CheW [Sandaracinaceae bacterium]